MYLPSCFFDFFLLRMIIATQTQARIATLTTVGAAIKANGVLFLECTSPEGCWTTFSAIKQLRHSRHYTQDFPSDKVETELGDLTVTLDKINGENDKIDISLFLSCKTEFGILIIY